MKTMLVLHFLKDVKSLSGQKNLEFVTFADPLYGECPMVRLCYYRYQVINFLTNIKELDHYKVSDVERNLANSFKRFEIIQLLISLADPVERTVREYSDRSLTSHYYG